jgi:hypothetical protein
MKLWVLYTPKLILVICGDISIMHLNDNGKTNQLDALLNSYNLFSTTDFPTRIYNESSSAIDDIFIDITILNNHQVLPLINGLSDHDAQIIILNVLQNKPHQHQPYFRSIINKYTIAEFKNSQSYETWDPLFECNDVNTIFNSFLNTYFKIFFTLLSTNQA